MKYFAMIHGRQVGPLTIEELVAEGITPSTYIWHKGMADWAQAREDAEICRHFRNRLHDLMHPASSESSNLAAVKQEPEPNPEAMNYWQIRSRIEQEELKEEQEMPPSSCPIWLIIMAFICCFPLAIIAIINKRKSLSLWAEGEAHEAHSASRKAVILCGVAICIGAIALGILINH